MRFLLISDTFPPLNNSGAVQLWDLAVGFKEAGHQLTVMVASPQVENPWIIEWIQGIEIVRVKTQRLKDKAYIKRTFCEFMMPFAMLRCLRGCTLGRINWDGIIWYSPSIFFGPLIYYLKFKNNCKTYLIVRDIFPEWAIDLGLIKKGLQSFLLKIIAKFQYALADTIGIQAEGNKKYFKYWRKTNRQLEVLHNWMTPSANLDCKINLSQSSLAGRLIFVYAGNMGVAQNVSVFMELAILMSGQDKIGFLFIGRGSQLASLKNIATNNRLKNVLFFDEIASNEIPGLLAQCHIGLIALDQRHQSHNIPGKFITYLNAGLPILANVNLNNDLINIIQNNNIGQVNLSYSRYELLEKANILISSLQTDKDMTERCKKVCFDLFSTQTAVNQITVALIN